MTRGRVGLLALERRWLHRARRSMLARRSRRSRRATLAALLHALMLALVLCLAVVR